MEFLPSELLVNVFERLNVSDAGNCRLLNRRFDEIISKNWRKINNRKGHLGFYSAEKVKQLQIQIQEAEAAALLGGKRIIVQLENRIRHLETALDEETRRHKETQNALRKKDRRIKEVQQLVDEEHKNFVMVR